MGAADAPAFRQLDMKALRPAGAGQPDVVSATPVLSDKGHQGGENFRHGAGRLSRPGDFG